MVFVAFLVKDKANQIRLFEETFLVTNISPQIVHGIAFLKLSDADIDFLRCELHWRTYTTKKALITTKRVKLVGKKEFAAAVFYPKYETYIVHIESISSVTTPIFFLLNVIYPSCKPQISGLIAKKACTKVPAEHSNFANVFSLDLTSKLLKHNRINDNAIKLVHGQQPPYRPIYSPRPVELEILKTYIEINSAKGFIRLFKSPAITPILFDQK